MQDGTNRKVLLCYGTYRKVHGALGALSAPFSGFAYYTRAYARVT